MTVRIVCGSAAGAARAQATPGNFSRETPPWNVREEIRERFRRVRAALRLSEHPDFCVALSSTAPGEGVSWVSAMLSCAIAEEDEAVILLDLNRRHPSQGRIFEANPKKTQPVDDCSAGLVLHETRWPNISLAATEVGSAGDVSSTFWLRQAVAQLRPLAKAVVIDCEPIRDSAQVLDLAPALDGILLVVEAERERRQAVQRCMESLRRANLPLLGVVLNKRNQYLPNLLYRAL
jgi:Mrp family chromosome partitioning ATPase